ncbi:MAG: CBS domain-containing protein [Candidatus Polarisedimenticolia bacterium]
MQDKNPNQRQTTQNPRREDSRQGGDAAMSDEEAWRDELGRQEERGRSEHSRGYYANALRRLRERGRRGQQRWRQEGERESAEPEWSWGRGSHGGGESQERWGQQAGGQDWRAQQRQGHTGFPAHGYGLPGRTPYEPREEGWMDESPGGYADRGWGQPRMQDSGQREREFGSQQDWTPRGQQDWGQREQGMTQEGRPRGRSQREDWGEGYGEVERSRWGGWAAPFLGGRRRRTHWNREPYTVRDLMTKEPQSVTTQTGVREVARLMKEENVGALPVVDDSRRLQGMVTDRDLVVRILAEERPVGQLRVEEIMTRDVEAVTEDEHILGVLDVMGRKQVRRLPVVDEQDRLLGIVSISDIAQKADYEEELQEALEKLSSRRSFWSRLWT